MIFTIQQSTLLKSLTTASKAVASSFIVPITECFLFDIAPDKLTIAATNMKFYIRTGCEIKGGEKKQIAINAPRLLGFIKDLADQELTFEVTDKLTITHSIGHSDMPFEDGKDFPKPIENKAKNTLSVNSDIILTGLDMASFCVAADRKDRLVLECLNIVIDGNSISFNATDGHKLATVTLPIESKVKANIVVPSYNIPALSAIPPNKQIDIMVDPNSLGFYYDQTAVLFTLFDEPYIDYASVIPTVQDKTCTVNKAELLGVINRVKGFSNTDREIKIDFSNDLQISCRNLDFSYSALETISCEYVGEPLSIGCNAEKLFAAIKKVPSENITFYVSAPNRAIILRDSLTEQTKQNLFLVMPVMLPN